MAVALIVLSAAPAPALHEEDGAVDAYRNRLGVGYEAGEADTVRDLIEEHGGTVVRQNDAVGYYTVQAPDGEVGDLIEDLEGQDGVTDVVPDRQVHTMFVPNDPLWADQWGPPAIDAPSAWNTTRGSSDVTVAVIDTGVDYTHSDLDGTFCVNGKDFVDNDMDSMDVYGHGTHVAGIIAAEMDNGEGVAGMSEACIMSVRVLGASGGGSWFDLTDSITWATNHSADIISMSLGGFLYVPPTDPFMTTAMQNAWDEGVLIVSAAGNSGFLGTAYPANYPQSMAVASTAPPDGSQVSGFSSRGPLVEIAAPGSDVLNTLMPCDPGVTLCDDTGYGELSGTSMATPHVSGVAALVWSENPSLTNAEVRCILDHTADDIDVPGRDSNTGYGLVNATAAVAAAQNGINVQAACPALGAIGV